MNTIDTPSQPASRPVRRRGRSALVVLGAPLVVVGLLWTTQAAPAKTVVGKLRLHRPVATESTPADPVRFLQDLELVMPRPAVPLSVGDAVAQELIGQSRSLTEQDALRTAQAVVEEARAVGYDPLLVLALIYVESYYDHFAVSPVGAEGLMQIMPDTGEAVARQTGLERNLGHTFDPVLNVRLGTRYLAQLQRQFGGNLALALTAYNRGPANTYYLLKRFDGHLPYGVVDVYAGKVLRRYQGLRATYGALPLT
jgi:soluble lytic murein transglycosylase-like protein